MPAFDCSKNSFVTGGSVRPFKSFSFLSEAVTSCVNARQVKFTSFLAFTLVFHCLLDVHLMWEELAVVRISISLVGAGPGELLLMKLVRVIR